MQRAVWFTLASVLVQAGQSPAQPATAPAIPPTQPVVVAPAGNGMVFTNEPMMVMDSYGSSPVRLWANAEYLLWQVSDGPVPLPLVTTGTAGNIANRQAGAIGTPGTRVLFGNQDLDYGTFSGLRAAVGVWLGADGVFGFEVSGLGLERRTTSFSASSRVAGSPLLAIPYFGPNTNNGVSEIALSLSNLQGGGNASSVIGAVGVSSTSRLWGDAATGVFTLIESDTMRWTALVGFRYLDLTENLNLAAVSSVTNANNTNYRIAFADAFATRNQFYGGQVGSRLSMTLGRFTMDLSGKLSLGSTHEVVDISGASLPVLLSGTNGAVIASLNAARGHGLFAQKTNIGRNTEEQFTVVPEMGVKVGFSPTQRLTVYAGYDALYLSHAVRPGNQIDRNINGAVPSPPPQTGPIPPAAITGHPFPLFNQSDFWAYGISFGVEFRY